MTSIAMYPLPIGKEKAVLISNDDYKLRLVSPNLNEQAIRQTCLGPVYKSPIKKMRVVPGTDKDKRIICYSTDNKIFGIIFLPFDGNPYKICGVIGHPCGIQDIKPSKNSDYIFTTGGTDQVINGWRYNILPMIDSIQAGGENIDPFLKLLEGGRAGLLFQEMVNFFYYAQIKSKEENTTKHRILSDFIPADLIGSLMCAMGYYPSKSEIKNIVNEIKLNKIENEKYPEQFNFNMFVK